MALAAALAALALSVGATYGGTIAGLVRQWAVDGNESHGFLVLPLAMWFAWRRRARLRSLELQPSAWGLPAIFGALMLLPAGRAVAEVFVVRLSLVLLVPAGLLFLFGPRMVRALRFPLAFLLLMVPLPAIVFNEIALPLQRVASAAGELALRLGGVPVLREGNVLELASMRLDVAEACSGIRSLMTLVTFGVLLGEMGRHSRARRAVLAFAAVPVAVVANAARVAVTGYAAATWGAPAVQGRLHATAGAIVFAATCVAVLAIERILHRPAARRA